MPDSPRAQWFIEPAALRAADTRSAFAPFAASIAAHSSFEWQVRVEKFEPVTGALRQTGFAGFGVVTAVASGVPVADDCANPALELSINAAAIISFIMRLPYVRGAYLHLVRKQRPGQPVWRLSVPLLCRCGYRRDKTYPVRITCDSKDSRTSARIGRSNSQPARKSSAHRTVANTLPAIGRTIDRCDPIVNRE